MLKELLIEIKKSNYISKQLLAEKLTQPIELIEDGFNQLIRMGYIKEDENLTNCNSVCGGCAYANACKGTPIKFVKITPKGENYLTKIKLNY